MSHRFLPIGKMSGSKWCMHPTNVQLHPEMLIAGMGLWVCTEIRITSSPTNRFPALFTMKSPFYIESISLMCQQDISSIGFFFAIKLTSGSYFLESIMFNDTYRKNENLEKFSQCPSKDRLLIFLPIMLVIILKFQRTH